MRAGKSKKKIKQAKAVAKLTAILGRKPNTPARLKISGDTTLAEVWVGRRRHRRSTDTHHNQT